MRFDPINKEIVDHDMVFVTGNIVVVVKCELESRMEHFYSPRTTYAHF